MLNKQADMTISQNAIKQLERMLESHGNNNALLDKRIKRWLLRFSISFDFEQAQKPEDLEIFAQEKLWA